MSQPTLEPGALLIIDGVARKVTKVEGQRVIFDNPDDAPRRNADGEVVNATRFGSCRLADVRYLDGVKAFYLEGRLSPPTANPNAVVPETADLKLP